ncbi:ATP-binding protein [Aureimonas flava]|uniref:ATP-binding protein n=1 Tax=Aureimonas flava TaxID=2320271 RepID=A0A3A1WTH1_9HYPH|nr:ATP-binding protein [Aureimonas flava]RIY01055.1 ATP-binding protein [Aureimonas flava]
MPPKGTAAEEITAVAIRPGVSVLSILRHLNYKTWFALAEFVDNSVQSYLVNKDRLEALHGRGFRLKVEIIVEQAAPSRIIIRDNAAGIALQDFPRAFRPAAIPPEREGLSEFGMGMKSAACWFAPRWSVRTKALGDPMGRMVRFDVAKIVRDEIEELEIEAAPIKASAHFTEVVLEQPYHLPAGRTVSKIKEHLTDIYRVYLRDEVLNIRLNGDSLNYVSPRILSVPYVRKPEDGTKLWRREISFDLGGGLSAHGFAALMDPMNTNRSGFALFRRGRLIEGSGDEGYRPSYIFGQPGNFRWRRLFGEIHLDGFEVSHTKDGFRWDENERPFLELLREELDKDDLPLLRQADLYRVQAPRNELADAAQKAIGRTVHAVQATLPEALPGLASEQPVETREAPLEPEPSLAKRELAVHFRDQKWLLRIELTNDPAQADWLAVSDQPAQQDGVQVLEIRLSLIHPFMVSFAQTDPDGVEALLRVAAGLALSEKLARGVGLKQAGTIRRNLNELLRAALAKP